MQCVNVRACLTRVRVYVCVCVCARARGMVRVGVYSYIVQACRSTRVNSTEIPIGLSNSSVLS